MSEIRLDRIHNQYVLIAPERLHRADLNQYKVDINRSEHRCPFCEGNESLTPPEVYAMRDNSPNTPGWKTRVVPNLYKAVQIELEDKSCRESMFESIPGVGAHEVLIDSTCHECGIKGVDAQSVEDWLRTMIVRIEDLKKDSRFIFLNIFKNFGYKAGSTQEHPHTQILALPIMPQDELVFLERNMKYYQRHGRGIMEDVLQNEISHKKRIVTEIGNFVAFCPYASGYPFEIMIIPKQNLTSLEQCSREDVTSLSLIVKEVFEKLTNQLGKFDYNLYFRLSPLNSNFENETYMPYIQKNYRFTLRIIPRIYRLGGFELSTGMSINPVSPEECVELFNSKETV